MSLMHGRNPHTNRVNLVLGRLHPELDCDVEQESKVVKGNLLFQDLQDNSSGFGCFLHTEVHDLCSEGRRF